MPQDRNAEWKGLDAATRARYMWRAALAAASPDATQVVFERAVRREVARMLEEGAPPLAVTAFESAAAEMHNAMELEGRELGKESGDE